jgi:hypothetical protein
MWLAVASMDFDFTRDLATSKLHLHPHILSYLFVHAHCDSIRLRQRSPSIRAQISSTRLRWPQHGHPTLCGSSVENTSAFPYCDGVVW